MAKLSTYKPNPGINPLDKITYSGIIEDYEDLPTYETVTNTLEDLGLFFAGNYFSTDGINYSLASIDGRITALESQVESDPVFALWDRSEGISITESQISNLQPYLTSYTESDPVFTGHTVYNISNGIGYLKNDGLGNWTYDVPVTTETDPVFTGHTVYNISNGTGFLRNDNGTWSYDTNTYLTSYTETDTLDTVTGRNSVTTNSISVGGITATGNNNFFSGQTQGPYRSALFSSNNSNRVGIYANLAAEDLWRFSQNGDGAIQSIYYAGEDQEELTQGMIIGAPHGSAMRFDGFNAVIHTGPNSDTAVIIDQEQNATFNGNITAWSFVNSNGSSTDFLKADGTLDSNSYPALDINDKIPSSYLPDSITGSLSYKGAWDASTETFPITPTNGDMYAVSEAGAFGDPSVTYNVGDWIIYNGSTWDHIQNGVLVTSVAGKTGAVTIGVNDLSDATITTPSNGQILKYNGTNWVNAAEYSYTPPSGTVVDANYAHITVTSTSVSDGTTTFNKYTAPAGTVVDSDYSHITVTASSVSDGTTTFNKYSLPSDVVQDSNYAHITVTSTSVSDGTTTFDKYTAPDGTVVDSDYSHITVTSTSVSDGTTTFDKYTAPDGTVVDSDYSHITVTESSVSDGTTTFNKYSLPTASSTVLGGVKIGYTESGKNYPVELDANSKMYVNVPWTDSDTVYSLPTASTTTLGGVKLGSDSVQSVAAQAPSVTAARTYAVQVNSTGKMVVNVPWTDGDTVYTHPALTTTKNTATSTLSHDGTFKAITAVTTNATGHLSDYTETTFTLPSDLVGDANVQSDWNATSGDALILNKPTIPSGALASLDSVNASTIADNSVGAAELNVSGNGTTTQYLRSDGDGTFTWATPPNTNTTYSAGTGLTLTGTTFSVAADTYAPYSHSHSYLPLTGGNITGTTDSTSYTTGALTIAGGLGVAKNIVCNADIVAYSSSDRNLKDNIKPIENALLKVNSIGGYEFDWNDKQSSRSGHDVGVIAQEIEKVLPEVVVTRDSGYKAVDYEKIVPLLIEAIKDLSNQVEELKNVST